MRRLILFVILAFAVYLESGAQINQSISLTTVVPTHCITNQACKLIIQRNAVTVVLVAKESGSGVITDSLGSTWTRDECTPFDNGECIFHAQFNYTYPIGDVLTFPSGGYADVYILQYQGTWNFVIGKCGTYAGQCGGSDSQNAPFPDCAGVGDCPYDWTLPVEVDAGSLLVAYSFPQASGPGLPKAGLGYSIEASDGFMAVEDMLAPTEGVYIGSLIWKMPDGSDSGGSHWLMGMGVYARSH